MRRTRSMMAVPSYSSIGYTYGTYRTSSPSLYTVRRNTSLPNLLNTYSYYSPYVPGYRPSFYRYYRDWNLRDDYSYDRRYYTSQQYWPYRSSYLSSSLDYNYPYSSYAYSYYRPYSLPYYNYDRPRYLSSYYDPYCYRPWSSYSSSYYAYNRPYAYENAETDRAWDMYRKGMVDYSTLDKYYLSPSTWYNRYSDYLKPYKPPISYSSYPHYQYSIDYR